MSHIDGSTQHICYSITGVIFLLVCPLIEHGRDGDGDVSMVMCVCVGERERERERERDLDVQLSACSTMAATPCVVQQTLIPLQRPFQAPSDIA